MHSQRKASGYPKDDRIDDDSDQAECEDIQRAGKEGQNWPENGVQKTQDKSKYRDRLPVVVADETRKEGTGDDDTQRINDPSDY